MPNHLTGTLCNKNKMIVKCNVSLPILSGLSQRFLIWGCIFMVKYMSVIFGRKSMKISKEKIKYLADTAMIEMDDAEREAQRKDLERISAYTEKLGELDTEGEVCMSHPFAFDTSVNRFRADEVTNKDQKEEWIKAAPDSKGTYIRVPRTVEE